MSIHRDELLEDLRRVTEIVERSPAERDMLEHGNFAYSTYFRYFESWSRAKAIAGVADPSDNEISDEELLEELERVNSLVEGSPTRREVDRLGEYPSSTYKYRFGSWNDALSAVDLRLNNASPGDGNLPYGPEWDQYRKRTLERDGYCCRVCGCSDEQSSMSLHVHHITPLREFERSGGLINFESAHSLNNLVTLCAACHRRYEGRYRDCSPDEFVERARD